MLAMEAGAASHGTLPVALRLARISSLNAADTEGSTPLAAAGGGYDTMVAALPKAGADPWIASNTGNTPLHLAAAAGRASVVLLRARIRERIDVVNQHRDTALILAVKARCADCTRTPLAAGASPRLRNADGLNAQDVARLSGDPALTALFD